MWGTRKQFFYEEAAQSRNANEKIRETVSGESKLVAAARANAETERQRGELQSVREWLKDFTFSDIVFWAFKKPISDVQYYYTYGEIKQYIKIKVSEVNMQTLSQYEVLAKILSQAFGGDKKKAKTPQTKQELEAIINSMGK